MFPKQRLLSALRGGKVDRVPWSPNLAYWLGVQSKEVQSKTQMQIMQEMGADPLIRGFDPTKVEYEHIRMYDIIYKNCEIENFNGKFQNIKRFTTPLGYVEAKYVLSPSGNTWFLVEHPIKRQNDFEIVRYLFDNIELIPNYSNYNRAAEIVGDNALIVPMLTPEITLKSAFQSLVEIWLGTQELVYAIADYPDEIDELVKSIRAVDKKAVEISAKSNAEVFITWEDTSTTNISPSYFKEYVLPELNEWSTILHSNNKMYMQHACGHLNALMKTIATSQIDGIESLSPPPTGNITAKAARMILPKSKFIVGGIEPTVFLNATLQELEGYVKQLLDDMKGFPFVLANSDSCPPGVDYEKFLLVSKIVRGEA